MKNITVGCDPEIFLINRHTGEPHSSIGLIGGTKEEPLPLADFPPGFALLEDNVAVEFNIAPAKSMEEFRVGVRSAMLEIRNRVGEDYVFSERSALVFPPHQLWHPAALVFGCDPDFNAWTGEQNPRPQAEDEALRSCGGHVHVGFTDLDKRAVVRAMDVFLGVPSTRMDTDTTRRKLYGKYGCYRPKPYGVEYRTLSNFWIFKDALINWVYEQTHRAVEFVAGGNEIPEEMGHLVRSAINDGNEEAAKTVSTYFGIGEVRV